MGIWRKPKIEDTIGLSKNITDMYANAGLSPEECLNDTTNVTARYNVSKGLAIGATIAGIGGIVYGAVKSIAAERQLRRDSEALQEKIDYANAMRARLNIPKDESVDD